MEPPVPADALGILQGTVGNRTAARHFGTDADVHGHFPREPRQIGALQRTVGNRSVARMLAQRRPAIQRDNPPGGAAHTPPFGSETALSRSQAIRTTVTGRLLKVAAYNSAADTAIQTFRNKRTEFASRWGAAWDRHNNILTAAGKEAASENMVEGIVIGVVAGVLVAAAAAALWPAAGALAVSSAGWWAFNTAVGAAGTGVGTAAAAVVARPDVQGPIGGRSDAAADAWRSIAEVERSARNVATVAPKFGLELGNAEYCIAQVQAHIDGGTTDMGWADTLDMVSTLANWENGAQAFDNEIDGKKEAIDRLGSEAQAFEVPDINRLEREIWLAWITHLTDDEVLDQDAIQRHLDSIGVLGRGGIYDYGIYMTDEDQHNIVRAARAHVSEASQPPGG